MIFQGDWISLKQRLYWNQNTFHWPWINEVLHEIEYFWSSPNTQPRLIRIVKRNNTHNDYFILFSTGYWLAPCKAIHCLCQASPSGDDIQCFTLGLTLTTHTFQKIIASFPLIWFETSESYKHVIALESRNIVRHMEINKKRTGHLWTWEHFLQRNGQNNLSDKFTFQNKIRATSPKILGAKIPFLGPKYEINRWRMTDWVSKQEKYKTFSNLDLTNLFSSIPIFWNKSEANNPCLFIDNRTSRARNPNIDHGISVRLPKKDQNASVVVRDRDRDRVGREVVDCIVNYQPRLAWWDELKT